VGGKSSHILNLIDERQHTERTGSYEWAGAKKYQATNFKAHTTTLLKDPDRRKKSGKM
jgi:hypothetical protein